MTPADYETMRPVFSDPEHGLCLNPVLACCLGSKCVGTWWELLFICLLHFGHATRYLGTSIPLMCITLLQHRTVAVAGHQWASSTGLDYERSRVFESTNDGTRPTTAGSHPWRSRDEEESALIVVPKVKQMKPAEVRRIMLKMTRFIGKKSTKKGVGGKGRAAHSRGKNLLTHNKQQNQVDDRRSRRWKSHGLSLLLRIRPHDVVEDVSFLGLLGSPFCLSSFLIAEGQPTCRSKSTWCLWHPTIMPCFNAHCRLFSGESNIILAIIALNESNATLYTRLVILTPGNDKSPGDQSGLPSLSKVLQKCCYKKL